MCDEYEIFINKEAMTVSFPDYYCFTMANVCTSQHTICAYYLSYDDIQSETIYILSVFAFE